MNHTTTDSSASRDDSDALEQMKNLIVCFIQLQGYVSQDEGDDSCSPKNCPFLQISGTESKLCLAHSVPQACHAQAYIEHGISLALTMLQNRAFEVLTGTITLPQFTILDQILSILENYYAHVKFRHYSKFKTYNKETDMEKTLKDYRTKFLNPLHFM
ncbi:hypothetical protein BLNAU_13895 [Blattamonas nauphoetae]|uniref:Uncharacterized protein n=1 Tax=Blattamonas nauphoetae TaxID=2049346 RepID=A0ABQ9XFB1_9EUKA|nr:hypothetical protein BLNAU_13895 [Blattamonas nauphoetae]